MRFAFGMSVAVLALGAGAVPSHAQHAQNHAAPEFAVAFAAAPMPLKFELFRGNRIFFDGTINGHRARMMLDSGATRSVVDSKFASLIGLAGGTPSTARGASGEIATTLFPRVTVSAGALTLHKTTVVGINLSHLAMSIGRPIDMILGRDAFEAGVLNIDFERREIRFLQSRDFVAPRGATKLEMVVTGDGIRRIPVQIGDNPPILADFDLGNAGSLLLAKPDWAASAQISALPYARSRIGGIGGHTERRLVVLPSVTVAGQRFDKVAAVLNGSESELPTSGANIGIELLGRFGLAIDFARNVLYLTPAPAAIASPIPKDRLGMGVQLHGDQLRVTYVSPDGPAIKAGLKEGDLITAINDEPVTSDFYGSRYSTMARLPAGTTLRFTGADGSQRQVTLTDYF